MQRFSLLCVVTTPKDAQVNMSAYNMARVTVGFFGILTGYLTDSMARGHLGGALPFLYDDPSSDMVLKPLLMNSFGGTEIGTRRAQYAARCSPIVTCNEFVIESLSRADDR